MSFFVDGFAGGTGNSAPLSWRQRIRIAVESAQGLEIELNVESLVNSAKKYI